LTESSKLFIWTIKKSSSFYADALELCNYLESSSQIRIFHGAGTQFPLSRRGGVLISGRVGDVLQAARACGGRGFSS
jgi:hypothetical protein